MQLMTVKRIDSNVEGSLGLEMLLSIYLLLTHLHYMFGFEGFLGFFVVGAFNLIGIVFFILMITKYHNWQICFFSIFMFIIGMLSSIYNNNYDIIYYLSLFRYMGIAQYLIYEPRNKKVITALMLLTLVSFIPVFFQPVGFTLFSRVSRNYHSVVLLAVNFVYNLIYIEKRKRINLVPTIISFFISILAMGRGGIIAYSIFLLGILIYNFQVNEVKKKGQKLKRLLLIIGTALIIAISLLIFVPKKNIEEFNLDSNTEIKGDSEIITSVMTEQKIQTNFEVKGLESPARLKLIDKYVNLARSSSINFLLGVPLNSDPYFIRYKFNLHNSYLDLHAGFGIIGFISMLILGVYTLYKIFKTKNWGLGLIFLAVSARVAVDKTAFLGHLDIILMIYFLQLFLKDNNYLLNNNFK